MLTISLQSTTDHIASHSLLCYSWDCSNWLGECSPNRRTSADPPCSPPYLSTERSRQLPRLDDRGDPHPLRSRDSHVHLRQAHQKLDRSVQGARLGMQLGNNTVFSGIVNAANQCIRDQNRLSRASSSAPTPPRSQVSTSPLANSGPCSAGVAHLAFGACLNSSNLANSCASAARLDREVPTAPWSSPARFSRRRHQPRPK